MLFDCTEAVWVVFFLILQISDEVNIVPQVVLQRDVVFEPWAVRVSVNVLALSSADKAA